MHDQICQKIISEKLIAIIRGTDQYHCLKTAEALCDGGICLVEVTFNQKDPASFQETAGTIQAIQQSFAGAVFPGAGTVMSEEQVCLAADAGARYIISPDVSQDVIRRTRSLGLVSMPGALSPSEIVQAYQWGADFVKVFPASSLGCDYIKAIKAPISHIPLMAVGGINADNLRDFLNAGCIGAGLGGNLVNKDWIQNNEYHKITETARKLVQIAKGE